MSFMAGIFALMYADGLVVFATSASGDYRRRASSHVLSMLGNTDIEQMLLSLRS